MKLQTAQNTTIQMETQTFELDTKKYNQRSIFDLGTLILQTAYGHTNILLEL